MVTRYPVAAPMCRCSLFSALKSMPQLSAHSAATPKSAEILAQLSLESETGCMYRGVISKNCTTTLKLRGKIIDVN